MSSIWIDQTSRLKSYAATVKGPKATVRVEIECDDPASLGYLLKELGDIQREQKLKAERDKAEKKAKPRQLTPPLLQITDMRGGRQ